jgi:DNA-binding CsgD family transcriptional regulator
MSIASFTAARDRLIAAADAVSTGEEACAEIALAFAEVAPHDASAVMTTDPETHLPAGGHVSGFDASHCVPFWDNELLDPDFNKFNDLAKSIEPVATLAEATDGDLGRSPRFQKLYEAAGVSDELRVVFMSGSSCLAIGAFVRCDGAQYAPHEIRDVRNLLVPAVHVLRSALGHMSEPLTGRGPVVVLLDHHNQVMSMSADADEVLDDLRIAVDTELPGTIIVAASRARASRSTTRLTTRLRGSSGRWVRLHVSPMAGNEGTVSVTIDAAAAGDLVPILLDSYGLSDRETDIVLLVCRGIGTKEIAAELSISVHTVRDHLKSIFDKANVNSRGELVAGLFTSHFLERFHTSVLHM